MPTHQPATMSVEQAGTLLGISRRSAYRAAAAGHLPTIRLGRRLLVPTHKLYDLLGIPTSVVTRDDDSNGRITDDDDGHKTEPAPDDLHRRLVDRPHRPR